MEHVADRESGRRVGDLATAVLEAPRHVGRLAEMVADDEVADATDDQTDGEAGRGRVHDVPERQTVLAHVGDGRDDAADRPAVEDDPALPDPHDRDRVGQVLAEMAGDVEQARPDDDAEDRHHEHVPDVVPRDREARLGAARDDHATDAVAHGDPEAVR